MRWCSGATAGGASSDVAVPPADARPRIAQALQQAIDAHQKGDLAAAEAGYAAILDEFPDEFGALHMLGVVRSQRGLHEEAVALITAALNQDERSADAHYNLGVSLAALGQHEEAAGHFERAVALKPDHANAHISLGNAWQALGRYALAIASYDRALALDPALIAALNNLGNALRAADRPRRRSSGTRARSPSNRISPTRTTTSATPCKR